MFTQFLGTLATVYGVLAARKSLLQATADAHPPPIA